MKSLYHPTVAEEILAAASPALLFFNGIGDHLVSLPAVRAVASLYRGEARLICHEDAPELFFSDVNFRSVIRIPRLWKSAEEVAFDADLIASEIGQCDALLSLNRSVGSSIARLLDLVKPKVSAGFRGPFTASLALRHDVHATEAAFDLPRLLCPGLELARFTGPPVLPAAAQSAARELRRRLTDNMRLMCVHIESTAGKGWGARALADLLGMFLERHRNYAVVVVGEKELGIRQLVQEGVVASAAGLPLPVSLALIGQSDLFLGVDSCMLHAADLFRVPGVGLFGPTQCSEFGFLFANHRHVSSSSEMTELSADHVFAALEQLLESRE